MSQRQYIILYLYVLLTQPLLTLGRQFLHNMNFMTDLCFLFKKKDGMIKSNGATFNDGSDIRKWFWVLWLLRLVERGFSSNVGHAKLWQIIWYMPKKLVKSNDNLFNFCRKSIFWLIPGNLKITFGFRFSDFYPIHH